MVTDPRWFDKIEEYLHNADNIRGFAQENRWLSNFESCRVEYENMIYHSSEGAYQAAKTLDLDIRKKFCSMPPSLCKKEGRKLVIREDWNDVKLQVMKDVLISKFTLNIDLKDKLIATGDKYLEETNWWGDTYWGVCNGIGENNLGIILMNVQNIVKAL